MRRRRKHPGHTPAQATVAPGAADARIIAIDALRGAAICAMIAYHFCFDLNWFGVFQADFNRDALWLTLRASIVTAFLLLVGVSLALAQRARISPHRYWRRIALIAGCALLVTAGSYFIFPRTFITFGILHCIAVASILTWPLVGRPLAALLVGIVVVTIGSQVQLPVFDSPWLNWVGLMTHKPATEDYVPLLPWVGVVCIGIAAGAWLDAKDYRPLRGVARRAPAWLNWLGRHSLLVYMVHQPLLIGLLRVLLP
ncbi:MAG: heparan-alpha-glucosaminide N-acetyltransferase [Casimicrobiaceae bacterium]